MDDRNPRDGALPSPADKRAAGADAPLGVSGRIAGFFQQARITPLLALVALLLGVFAVLVTPREEEPQIDVTMANVFVGWPGASVADVEAKLATPAEQVLSRMPGVEHVMSVSRPGVAVLTVQFKVGVARSEALVRLHDAVSSNADWLPQGLGVLPPVIKPKGIDDVPIVSLTLHSADPATGAFALEQIAHSIETDLKRVPGTRDVWTIGGPGRAVVVELDPERLAGAGLAVGDLRRALQSASAGAPAGELVTGNRAIAIEAGPFLRDADDVADLVVAARDGRPVHLRDVAEVRDGPLPATRMVWYGRRDASAVTAAGAQPTLPAANPRADGSPGENATAQEVPAITIAITKKPGENAIDVADAVIARADALRNTVIPAGVELSVTRNYGATANDKAVKLIQKLMFATASVVALVFIALGRREAAIVGAAVVLTLTVTLFASWAWGFTLNRVSLFALIFSIGILVDDAIVVVENIHRHQALHPGRTLAQIIPGAVDEVGGPTILATLTVIAALLPMAFVSGLMGPYMGPIPINASMGMLLSLAVAFVVTPWLSGKWMKTHGGGSQALAGDAAGPAEAAPSDGLHATPTGLAARLDPFFRRLFAPFLDVRSGSRNRRLLGLGIAGLVGLSVALPVLGLVQLKMLPFDNKSEFQIVVDMPAGTPVEQTAAVLRELGAHLATVPEVTDWQSYAGTAAPINFNGLVRQYYLRASAEMGDIQVNLTDKHHRKLQSHAIATRERPALQAIGARFGANVKLVEVPPGPPVLAPIVAEITGPDADGRRAVAKQVRAVFERTDGVVDVDDSSFAAAPRRLVNIDRAKASLAGVPQAEVVATLRAGLAGEDAAWLHDASRTPVAAVLRLPAERQGDLDSLLQLPLRNARGGLVPLRELVTVSSTEREQPAIHKDLLPVVFVTGDMAGKLDSPLYGMFGMRADIARIVTPGGGTLVEHFIRPPADAWRDYAIKWDGEWQITYDTFRDMGAAYAVGLVLIYLLVVAQFGSYLVPLIIMAPIPLTLVGVMPGHALLGSQFTATSMIGMIALAGIIVRNSILLVDFIQLERAAGVPFERAVVNAAATRAQPIVLTGLAAMLGAFFILDDPIFNGLAIALIFGILVSTLLTLVVIPLLYFSAFARGEKS
ncbi:efflux RND transporter permease subunit [Derxia gummosa]|uniref:Efflux RND transporter permease subunit n=1 Tax=Derxia gummosa DSM 723 TaxID=1121388 RepID=A0A8B6X9W1_9BURK|nr:efflux RND transporter permease subunit [Derxia gummosa]